MKSSVNDATAKNCPTCCRPLPAGSPAGLCPACLLAQGAETESGAGGQPTRFVPPSLAEVAALFPQLEILRLLGAGGMGAVYQARQPELGRFVALKILPAGTDGGANFSERFNREARALAKLSHPNIVTVHEFGQAGRLHYFLMEFVDGANLRQLEQAGRLSAREALQIIPQICDALQYAHDEGVVHRDIKPENVLVDRKGRVKIADFGLAKIMGHDPDAARLTVEGQVMGTPHYMAPEQFERPLSVDHRADIYSLGVVFYELLTGDLPLGKFAPPSRKVQVDVRLDEIVLRALENDPARRYQQASEVKSGVATVVDTPAPTNAATASPGASLATAPKPGVRYLRWLGIPAVVERDGEREVNLQGALGVFFVMLMTSALTQQAVQWLTGGAHAMVQLSFVTAALMAIWAIRRTMNQPANAAPPRRAANGTVILSPSPRRRYLLDGLMVAGLIAFTVGSHFLKVRALNSWSGGSSEPKAAQVGQPNPATGTSLVRHPGGGTVELLGISDPDSATNGWWQADGTQTRFTLGVREVAEPSATNALLRNFVLQFAGLGPDTVERIEFESALASSGHSGADEVIRDGKSVVTDARRYLVSFPVGLTKTKIRIAWGTGDWQTALSMAAPIWRESPQGGVSNSKWRLKFVGQPAMAAGELQVSYLCGRRDPLWSHRLVAIDHQGREHDSQGGTGTGTGGGPDQDMVFVMQFRGLDLADVKEFQLQSRPIQWVEFPDVALNPQKPLPRREALRLAEPLERTFDELIDFDTGRVAAFPPGKPGANPLAGIGENVLWAQQNGFDAVASNGKLDVLDADFAPLDNADWDRLTAQEVINRLHRGLFRPRTLKELRPGEFPATYAYRTREQGYGMIQLVSFDPQRPGATVWLKQVVRTPSSVAIRAEPHPQTRVLTAKVSGGKSIELIALKAEEANVDAWRRPDGSPAEGFGGSVAFRYPYALRRVSGRRFQLLFQVEGLALPDLVPVFEFPGALLSQVGGTVWSPHPNPESLLPVQVAWPDATRTATARVGVPLGEWSTIRSYDPVSRTLSRPGHGGDPHWSIEMHTAIDGTNGVQVAVVFGSNYPDWNLRVVEGTSIGRADRAVTNGPVITKTFVFAGRSLESVRNFQVQAQPLEWVEFVGIELPKNESGRRP